MVTEPRPPQIVGQNVMCPCERDPVRNSLGSHAPLFDIPQPGFPGIDEIQVINVLGAIVWPEPVRQCLVSRK